MLITEVIKIGWVGSKKGLEFEVQQGRIIYKKQDEENDTGEENIVPQVDIKLN